MKYLWILFIGLTIAAKAQTIDFKYTAVDPRPFAYNANHYVCASAGAG
jgi:hypothetical protein